MSPRQRWISTALLSAAAAAAPALSHAQASPPFSEAAPVAAAPIDAPPRTPRVSPPPGAGAAAGATAPAEAQLVARELRRLVALLRDSSAPVDRREEAARRLARRPQAGGGETLRDVLRNGDREGRLAVARALSGNPSPPDPDLVADLSALLGSDRALSEAGAQALSTYKGDAQVLDVLARVANDRQRLPSLRIPAIRAVGQMVEPASAKVLVALLTDASEPTLVRNAAADALVELTGLAEYGRDAARWQRWVRENANKAEADWKRDLTPSRAAWHDRLVRRNEALLVELDGLLFDEFQAAQGNEQKAAFLLRLMGRPAPDLRAAGAVIAGRAAEENRQFPAVNERLAELVGDSTARVRLEVVKALRAVNYQPALEPLLAQLSSEPDPDVRAAAARVLARIESLRQIPALARLLDDPSPAVVRAAAEAIRMLGEKLRGQDPRQAERVAERLWEVIRRNDAVPGSADLREACARAIIPLRGAAVLEEAPKLLDLAQPVGIRIAALQMLGESRDSPKRAAQAAGRIATWLPRETAPEARRAALVSLGLTGGVEFTRVYFDLMQPNIEPAQEVRDTAWLVFQSPQVMGEMTEEQLVVWAQQFRDQPDRRVRLLEALADNLKADGQTEQWAIQLQNIGVEYLRLKQYAEAAAPLAEALEYFRGEAGTPPRTVERLVELLLDARLGAADYEAAADVGQRVLAGSNDRSLQQTVGAKLAGEAERLRDARAFDRARSLTSSALKMDPPLDERYQEILRQVRAELPAPAPQPGGGAGPRTAVP